MIELLFTACLLSHPGVCEEKSLIYVDVPSPMACMIGAQPQLALWSEQHPAWRIGGWKCRWVATADRKA